MLGLSGEFGATTCMDTPAVPDGGGPHSDNPTSRDLGPIRSTLDVPGCHTSGKSAANFPDVKVADPRALVFVVGHASAPD